MMHYNEEKKRILCEMEMSERQTLSSLTQITIITNICIKLIP